MPKILVSDSLSREGLEILAAAAPRGIQWDYKPGASEDELVAIIGAYEGLVICSSSSVSAKVIDAAPSLRVIGRAGIGVDNVDVLAASRRGIVVMNTPTGNAVTTAEHALALLFAVSKRIGLANSTMKQGRWQNEQLKGRELTAKTLGIIGLGNIGRIVADRAQGLRMHVIAFDPVLTPERAQELGVELVSFEQLLVRADAITIHTPKNPQTMGLINDDAIAKMKPGVIVINVARGGICDEAAVVRGLESGQIGGAGFDVFAEEPPGLTPLVGHAHVVATPHLGASTEEAQTRVAVEICEQVVAYLTQGTIANSVNTPAVPKEQAALLSPYITLGRRLGQFLGAVENLNPRSIAVELGGDAAFLPAKPIVHAAVAGTLANLLGDEVNDVNAPIISRDRGIELKESKSTEKNAYSTFVRLVITDQDGQVRRVTGTLGSNQVPRIVGWGPFEMDARLDGTILVLRNRNKPGVIGQIGMILGESRINVSRLQVALDATGNKAVQLWGLDSKISESVLILVRGAKDVDAAFGVQLS